jgi:hypothetical protein
VFYDLRDELLVVSLSVLFVEDAIGFVAQTDAAKAMFTIKTGHGIQET